MLRPLPAFAKCPGILLVYSTRPLCAQYFSESAYRKTQAGCTEAFPCVLSAKQAQAIYTPVPVYTTKNLNQILATPLLTAASAVALATASLTLGSKAAGRM